MSGEYDDGVLDGAVLPARLQCLVALSLAHAIAPIPPAWKSGRINELQLYDVQSTKQAAFLVFGTHRRQHLELRRHQTLLCVGDCKGARQAHGKHNSKAILDNILWPSLCHSGMSACLPLLVAQATTHNWTASNSNINKATVSSAATELSTATQRGGSLRRAIL